MKHLKIIGGITIGVGILLVLLGVGSAYDAGTLIAGAGVALIVYAVLSTREKQKRQRQHQHLSR